MSLIKKENLNYLTTVEQFFLSLKDSGLHLSASDTHWVSQCEERGVPVEKLCRAIEAGYDKASKQERSTNAKWSLTHLQDLIEQELQKATR
jgi:predicted DNA-binding protein (MmcQ/YjbR family)